MNSVAASSDFQKTLKQNRDGLTVEEVWDKNFLYIYIKIDLTISIPPPR